MLVKTEATAPVAHETMTDTESLSDVIGENATDDALPLAREALENATDADSMVSELVDRGFALDESRVIAREVF